MQQETSTASSLDPQVVNLAKAIRQTESGGNFSAKGKSGEFGAYQFTEPTWNVYAKKHGVDVPLQQATPEQQNEVAYKQIKEWKDQGKNVGQIASLWNSGKEDAYLDTNYKGVNKMGVSYDVPAYAKSVALAYQTLKSGGQVNADPNNPSSTANATPVQPPEQQDGFLKSVAKGIIKPVATMVARPIQLGAELLGASPETVNQTTKNIAGDFVAPVPQSGKDVVKDIGRAAETVALGLPVGSIAKATGTGILAGVGSGLESKGTASEALKQGAVGGALGLGGGLISKALEVLPTRLTKGAFGLSDEEAQKMLQTKSIGTKNQLLAQSEKAVAQQKQEITGLIRKAVANGKVGSGNDALRETLLDFPKYNSEEGVVQLGNKLKDLISNKSGVGSVVGRGKVVNAVDKIIAGTATLEDKDLVRSALDSATKGGYAKLAQALNPSAGHDLAMTFADKLRNEVQSWVPETQPLFKELSKEAGIKSALAKLVRKKGESLIGYNDVLPYMLGGGQPVSGTITAGAFKAARTPAFRFGLAKTIQGVGKLAKPISSRAGLLPTILKGNQ